MSLLAGAIRSAAAPTARDHLRAALLTAVLPSAAGFLLVWLFPAGCDVRGDPALYRWTCLFPGLLVPVAATAAVFLPLTVLVNGRLGRPVPDGWLATPLLAGAATQASLVGGYVFVLDPAYRELFLGELLFLPQPFLAGLVAGAVFAAALGRGSGPT